MKKLFCTSIYLHKHTRIYEFHADVKFRRYLFIASIQCFAHIFGRLAIFNLFRSSSRLSRISNSINESILISLFQSLITITGISTYNGHSVLLVTIGTAPITNASHVRKQSMPAPTGEITNLVLANAVKYS